MFASFTLLLYIDHTWLYNLKIKNPVIEKWG